MRDGPSRVEVKTVVPSRAIVKNTSPAVEFSGGPGSVGGPQPADVRSTNQVANVRPPPVARGRSDVKYKRRPSGAMNGSTSRKVPEKAAATGADHVPAAERRDFMIVSVERSAEARLK